MKAKFKPNLAAIFILACIIIGATGNIWILIRSRIGSPLNHLPEWSNRPIKPIDELKEPAYNIPYYKYNEVKDSLLRVRDLKNGDDPVAIGREFAYLGTQVSLACDTCSYAQAWKFAGIGHVQNYIKLYAWTIKRRYSIFDEDGVFHVKNSQGYLRESFDDTSKNGFIANGHKIYLTDVPVKFRYSRRDNALLIPVSKRGADLFGLACRGLWTVCFIVMLVLYYLFLRLVYDLSKGISFTRKNVVRLRFIAVCIIGYPVAVILLNLLMKLLFHNYFTEDIELKDVVWTDAWDALPLGVLFSLLYMAFSRAVALQEEHDLTV